MWGFAEPEGESWRSTVGVFDKNAAGGFDALNAPAGVTEEDDVAGPGVDGEVLVEGGYLYPFRLQYYVVESDVGDGPAVGDGYAASSAARMEVAIDCVMKEIGAVPTAAGLDAIGEKGDEFIEAQTCEIAIRIGAAEDVKESFGLPGFGSAGRLRSAASGRRWVPAGICN